MANPESPDKRPCCRLLRELSTHPESLSDPKSCAELLETMSKHCVLVHTSGKGRVKLNLEQASCYLVVNPESAQEITDEATKTVVLSSNAKGNLDLLAKINHLIANNALIQQFSDRIKLFLARLREGERRFGRVPDTSLIKDNPGNELGAGDLLKAHPYLDKTPQFDGTAPKANPLPTQNPDAPERAQELANQLRAQPGFNPRPKRPGYD